MIFLHHYAGIKRSPHEAMFGIPARVGLERTGLPSGLCQLLREKEELEDALNGMYGQSDRSEDDIIISSTADAVDLRVGQIAAEGVGVKECLIQQAKKMKRDSDAQFPPPEIGATVRIPVPDVDRAKLDDRSILARVLRVAPNDLYELGTRNGRLEQLYARSQFSICSEIFLNDEDIPQNTISLRSAARKESEDKGGHGQGFLRRQCTRGCDTNRCICRRKALACNSKCHGSKSCANK